MVEEIVSFSKAKAMLFLTSGKSAKKLSLFCQQNPCSSSPCLNNGICQAGFTYKGFRCVCRERFTGETCQVSEGEMSGLCGPLSRVVREELLTRVLKLTSRTKY